MKFILGLAFAATAAAHVSLSSPCVRYTPFCDSCPELPAGASVDNNINAPIGTHESISQPLCKYQTPYGSPAAEWTAGSTVDIKFRDHAAVHGGGHCQFALSYDGGKTFVVIHDELRHCFTGSPSSSNTASKLSYSIPLPADLPSGDKVVFAWAWNNAIGNREFYMNCADVSIKGSGSSFSGPEMLVANYGPDSPLIPEFNGDYETGIDLYTARKTITVSGSGGGGAGYTNGSASASPAGPGASEAGLDTPAAGPGTPAAGPGTPEAGLDTPEAGGDSSAGGYSGDATGAGGASGAGDTPVAGDATGAGDTPVAGDASGAGGYSGAPVGGDASAPDAGTDGSDGTPTSSAPAGGEATPSSGESLFSTTPAGPEGGYAATPSPGAPAYRARVAPVPAYRARVAPIPAPAESKCT